MKSFWNLLHKIGSKLHLPEMPVWLIGILALVMILRIPSLFEPYYYGDEMIYMTLGTGVRQGEILYKDLHDNKPPLLYWAAAIAGNLFTFKAILAFWNIATIFVFWKLTERLMNNPPSPKASAGPKIATLVFALLTSLPLFEGNIVNAELFMIGPTILAFYILLSKELNIKNLFFSGILFSVASLFKIPAAFEVPVIIVYWLITDYKNWKTIIKKTFILSLGFMLPIALTFIWYYLRGAFNEYLIAAYLQNLGYVKSWKVRDVPMMYRIATIVFGVILLWIARFKISKKFIFLSLWTMFALFGVVLSGRPYPHYFIQAIAPVSILLAMFFSDKSIEQSLVVIPLALSFFVPVYYKFWLYPVTFYYERFINFSIGKITKEQYFNQFNDKATRNYDIARFLSSTTLETDRVFMWDSDSSTVYSLARRLPPIKYVADYHINDFSSKSELMVSLNETLPKMILLSDSNPLPEIKRLITDKYHLIQRFNDVNIFLRTSN